MNLPSMKFGLIPALMAFFALLPASCTDESRQETPEASAFPGGDADSVLAVLASLRQDAKQAALGNLETSAYSKHVRTEQIGPDGGIAARREHIVRYAGEGTERTVRLISSRSQGAFAFGWFGRFVSSEDPEDADSLTDNTAFLMPTDPAYLEPRSRDAFRYALGPDTLLNGRRARVLAISVRRDEAEEQSIRQARLFFDPDTRQVLALSLIRENPAFLFREVSRIYIEIRQGEQNQWLPDSTSILTRINMPLGRARTFRTQSSYRDFDAVE